MKVTTCDKRIEQFKNLELDKIEMILGIFFGLTLLFLALNLIFYVFKRREEKRNMMRNYTGNLLKSVIIIFSGLLLVIFVFNTNKFSQPPSSFTYSLVINASMMISFFSLALFMISRGIENKYIIKLDYPSRAKSKKGTIKMGRVMRKNKALHEFYLDLKDLAQHVFITGTTGSGKSNFLQYFIHNLKKKHDIPFLLAEFKGEYQFFQRLMKDVLILKVGENFSINIFDPEGSNAEIHAERVFQIFKSGGLFEGIEYSPQMEKVFVDMLREACKNEEKRNWEAFREISDTYLGDNRSKMQYLEQSLMAVNNRIRRYSLGTLRHIFTQKNGLNVKELFEHNIILDLSSIIRLGGEKEDALFFLNMIMKYLWDRNISKGSKGYDGIKHITIVEDAQYFAPQEMTNRTRLTSYLEDIALLLRGTGECLVSIATRPNVSEEILANCGVLISFQTHIQKTFMGELLNLDEEKTEYLSMLKKGQSIMRVNSIEKPFVLKTPLIERKWLTNEEILENNQKTLNNKSTD